MLTKHTAIYSTKRLLLTVSSAALQHAYDDPLTRPPTINAGIIIIM